MRRTNILSCLSTMTVVGLVACNGGGGTLPSFGDGWDEDRGLRNQREQPIGAQDAPLDTSEDPPNRTNEPSPGSGGGALVCSGIYECILTGEGQSCIVTSDGQRNCTSTGKQTIRVRIELKQINGVCFIGEAVLEPNGTLRGDDADEVGRWSVKGNRLLISAGAAEGYCVPSSGPVGLVGPDGKVVEGTSSGSGSGSTQTGGAGGSADNGNISIDPGPQGDGGI